MALHRELQQNWPEYPVQASAQARYNFGCPVPGDFCGGNLFQTLLFGLHRIGLAKVTATYDSITEYFQEPYASQLDDLFNGENSNQ